MDQIKEILSEQVKRKKWRETSYLNDIYKTVTLGSGDYPTLLKDYNTFMYIKMILNNYYINKYSIQETKAQYAHGITIYIQKDEFCKMEYFMNSIV